MRRASCEHLSWVVSRNEIRITKEELGRCSWGQSTLQCSEEIKLLPKSYTRLISSLNRSLFAREMHLSATIQHSNMVMIIGATIEGELIILTELMETNLKTVLETHPSRKVMSSILQDVALTLNYLHLQLRTDPLVLRNVSSPNILLDSSTTTVWKEKLSDFGALNFDSTLASMSPGNPFYAAPETPTPSEQSPKMDVLSYGILIAEMILGNVP